MYRSAIEDIIKRLEDPEYAKKYGAEMAKSDLAVTLWKARSRENITQSELAKKLVTSQPYIARLEGGEANPTIGAIGSLLATIGLRLITGTAPLVPRLNVPNEPASEESWVTFGTSQYSNAATSGLAVFVVAGGMGKGRVLGASASFEDTCVEYIGGYGVLAAAGTAGSAHIPVAAGE